MLRPDALPNQAQPKQELSEEDPVALFGIGNGHVLFQVPEPLIEKMLKRHLRSSPAPH